MEEFKNLKLLYYYRVLHENESINSAAKVLGITPSTLSRAMRSFEEGIGKDIFKRSAKGISYTAFGDNLYKYALESIAKADAAEKQLFSLGQKKRHSVNILYDHFFHANCTTWPMTLKYGEELNFKTTKAPKINFGDILSGRYDLIIGCFSESDMTRVKPILKKDRFVITPVFEDMIYFSVPKDHPLASCDEMYLEHIPAKYGECIKSEEHSYFPFWLEDMLSHTSNNIFFTQTVDEALFEAVAQTADKGYFVHLLHILIISRGQGFPFFKDRKLIRIKNKNARRMIYVIHKDEIAPVVEETKSTFLEIFYQDMGRKSELI